MRLLATWSEKSHEADGFRVENHLQEECLNNEFHGHGLARVVFSCCPLCACEREKGDPKP